MFSWLWVKFTDLPWWGMGLWVIYMIYFIGRSFKVWDKVESHGLLKGYKQVFLGYGKELHLYHIIRMLIDIPPAIIGLLFPILRRVLSLKLHTFKDEK